MGLFQKTKKTEAVTNYSPPDQAPPPPAPKKGDECKAEEQLERVLQNQVTIVANQQTILDSITNTQQLIVKLASGESDPEPEPEPPTEEEMKEALRMLREAHKNKPVPTTNISAKDKVKKK